MTLLGKLKFLCCTVKGINLLKKLVAFVCGGLVIAVSTCPAPTEHSQWLSALSTPCTFPSFTPSVYM